MMKQHMIPWEMAELASLLRLYIEIYGPAGAEATDLLREIDQRLSEIVDSRYTEKNPRGAGRHSKITSEQKKCVIELYSQNKSIRDIAGATGLSVGSVHKLINEQSDNKDELVNESKLSITAGQFTM